MGYFRFQQAAERNRLLRKLVRATTERSNRGSGVELKVTLPTGDVYLELKIGESAGYRMTTHLESGESVTTEVDIELRTIHN